MNFLLLPHPLRTLALVWVLLTIATGVLLLSIRRRKLRRPLMAMGACWFLVALGLAGKVMQWSVHAVQSSSAMLVGAELAKPVPEFSFTALDGRRIATSDLRGKTVLLEFWASWCPDCRKARPEVEQLQRKYAGRPFTIVGISDEQDEQKWKDYLAAHGQLWPEFLDRDHRLHDTFQVTGIPTFVIIDGSGTMRFRQAGWLPTTYASLDRQIEKAMSASASEITRNKLREFTTKDAKDTTEE
jgi:thiol-disulfide isomerase/thioredoxin